jgi:hypothetical protein
MSLTRNSLYRMADAIKEIRLMGETEGLTSEWVSWDQVLDGVFQRLRENLSEQGLANLHVDRGFMEGIQIHAHPLVLTICLERLFRRLIKSNNQALFVRVSSQQQTADQGIFDFHFSGDNVCWPAELGELGAALTYILRSQGIQLSVRERHFEIRSEILVVPESVAS